MNCFIAFLFLAAPLFGQALPRTETPPLHQAYVYDIKGSADIQYRPIVTPVWNPVTPGMRLSERTLIRLNRPDSTLTLSFSDGSFVRLFGLGSYYLDTLNQTVRNVNQTRILLLTGRWFYSSNPMEPARFIVNSDVTSSIIENGSGGGFFYKGQSEMLIRTGRGLFGWRQQDIPPVILDPNQIMSFNIRDGFSKTIEAASLSNYIEYGLFEPAEPAPVSFFTPLQFQKQTLIAQNKAPLNSDQIYYEGLNSLEHLDFVRKEDALAVGIARTITNVTVAAAPPPAAAPKPIPLSLLMPIDLKAFEVAAPSTAPAVLVKKPEPAPVAPPAPAPRVRQKRQAELEAAVPVPAAEAAAPETIDLAAATANIKVEPEALTPQPRRRAPAPAPRVVVQEPPLINEDSLEAPPPVIATNPAPRPKGYKAPKYYNQDHFTNDPAFQYKKFEVNSAEDLLQGDFSRSLFY